MKITLSNDIRTNLLLSDILPNEDNFKTTERISCGLQIPIFYKNKPTQFINLSFYIKPCGNKNIKELLIEDIPKHLSEKQKKCYIKNGVIIFYLWSNRQNLINENG